MIVLKISKRWLVAAMVGAVATPLLLSTPRLVAQQRGNFSDSNPPQSREAFKSGGERSELVLQDIARTLIRIDARLERMEARLDGKLAR